MKLKKRYIGAVFGMVFLLTACGGSSYMMTNEAAAEEWAADTAAAGGSYLSDGSEEGYGAAGSYKAETAVPLTEPEMVAEAAEVTEDNMADTGEGAVGNEVSETTGKKLIRNVNLEVETQEFDALVSSLRTEVETLGGYVENFTSSDYNEGIYRDAYIVARIPSPQLDGFLERVNGQSNVIYQNETVEDVTLQYVDLETHKKVLLTERDRLLELLEQAEEVADLIEIESRLSEVRYQIESLEAQLRILENQITYSTVYLSVREVKLYTPAAEKSIWEKISEGFVNNVYILGWRAEEFLVDCVVNLPFLLIWLVLLIVFVIAVRMVIRFLRKWFVKRRDKWKKMQEAKREQLRSAQAAAEDYEIIPAGDSAGKEAGQEQENGEKQNG